MCIFAHAVWSTLAAFVFCKVFSNLQDGYARFSRRASTTRAHFLLVRARCLACIQKVLFSIGLSTPAVLHNHLVLLGFISPAGPAEALRRARCRATASFLLHLCLYAPALLALAVALSAFAVLYMACCLLRYTLGRLLYGADQAQQCCASAAPPPLTNEGFLCTDEDADYFVEVLPFRLLPLLLGSNTGQLSLVFLLGSFFLIPPIPVSSFPLSCHVTSSLLLAEAHRSSIRRSFTASSPWTFFCSCIFFRAAAVSFCTVQLELALQPGSNFGRGRLEFVRCHCARASANPA